MAQEQSNQPWKCERCKAMNDPEFVRCKVCGDPRPGVTPPAASCKACGHSIFAKDTCCPACGSKEFLQL